MFLFLLEYSDLRHIGHISILADMQGLSRSLPFTAVTERFVYHPGLRVFARPDCTIGNIPQLAFFACNRKFLLCRNHLVTLVSSMS